MNHLQYEKSPYLLQHQDNPVHWHAWGEEAFQAAQQENKLIFLSIGYSTCHWCHVMAHESFEAQEVADFLNAHFIAIKVDREERPDVDEIYMSAVHSMGQRGGWPLSMFLTPERKPFFGGTYWPKPYFLEILDKLSQLWRSEPEKVRDSAEGLVQQLRMQKEGGEIHLGPPLAKGDLGRFPQLLQKFYEHSKQSYDSAWGGFSPAPKFPHPMQLSLLLRISRRTQEGGALQMVVNTLEKMAYGGLYDHLGGGFARYSVDAQWQIPHFEKMLYDNALLAVAYLEAFQVTQLSLFETVARETLDYVLKEMTSPEGGFYSAQDADSEGVEGKYYVWSYEELKQTLTSEEFEPFVRRYQVTPQGNFEGTTHLNLSRESAWEEKETLQLKSAHEKLLKIRAKRIPPHKDDKILTAWNGLMIRAMALGYQVLGEERYLKAAHGAAEFIKAKLFDSGQKPPLQARYRDGEARFAARLEDGAFLIQGLIDLYQCDFKPEVLNWAVQLQAIQDQLFWDDTRGAYYFTDGQDPSLLLRTKEGMDGAVPNANGVSAANLLRLYDLDSKAEYLNRAQEIFSCYAKMLAENPHHLGAVERKFAGS